MNTTTQSKPTQIAQSLDARETYLAFVADWAAKKEPTARAHAAYIIGKGLLAKKPKSTEEILDDLMDAFGPITNSIKLANGRRPFDTLDMELVQIQYNGTKANYEEELELRIRKEASELLSELRIQLRNGR